MINAEELDRLINFFKNQKDFYNPNVKTNYYKDDDPALSLAYLYCEQLLYKIKREELNEFQIKEEISKLITRFKNSVKYDKEYYKKYKLKTYRYSVTPSYFAYKNYPEVQDIFETLKMLLRIDLFNGKEP